MQTDILRNSFAIGKLISIASYTKNKIKQVIYGTSKVVIPIQTILQSVII